MRTSSTRSTRRLRVLALLQATLLVASLGIPRTTIAALTVVAPGAQAPSPVTAGGTATFNVQVTNGSGTSRPVSITSISGLPAGATLAASGCTTVPNDGSPRTVAVSIATTAATPVGTHTITMTATRWTAASGCTGSAADTLTGSASLVVAAAPLVGTTTAITSDAPDPSSVGSPYTVDVSVTRASGGATITGTVTVSDGTDSCTDSTPTGGSAATVGYSCDLISTTTGAKTLTASFPGNATFGASSGTASHTVSLATSTTVVTCPAGVVFDGSAQTPCTVTVTGSGGLSLSPDPTYSANTNVGTATASYTFAGDAGHSGSSDSTTFEVTPAPSATVVSCPASVVYTGSAQTPCTVAVTGAGGLSLAPAPTYTANTAVGTATAAYTYSGDANHGGSSDAATFQITASGVVVTPGTPPVLTYGDPLPADPSGGATASVPGTFSFSPLPGTVLDAGDQPVHLTFTPADANYALVESDITVTVLPAPLTVTVDDATRTYGAANPAFTVGAAVLVNGDTVADLAGSPVFATAATAASPVGDYPVGVSGLTSSNYAITFADGTLAVTPADAICVVTGFAGTYDGTAHGAAGSCTGVDDETLPGLSLGASFTNVPGGSAHWSFSDGNYNPASGSVDVVITRADAECTIEGFSGTYDGTARRASGACTGVSGDTLPGLDRGASFTDVPGGPAAWTFTDATGNYRPDSGSVDIEITQVEQAIAFPDIPAVTLGAPRIELQATTASGLPIAYRSLSPKVCTVSGATVAAVGVGTCRVEASQAGDVNHAPAVPVTRSFDVAAADTTAPADTAAPETSTISPIEIMGGSGPLPTALLLGLLAVGVMASALMLLGFRARRDGFTTSGPRG